MIIKQVLLVALLVLALASVASAGTKESKKLKSKSAKKQKSIVRKELCVIGGGAAGAYTAYEAQKRGYDTVLIEPQDDLGGNCQVFELPSTINPAVTYTLNAAVVIFPPTDVVTTFFEEMNVTADPINLGVGKANTSFIFTPEGVWPLPKINPTSLLAAISAFQGVLSKHPYKDRLDTVPNFEGLSKNDSKLLLEPFSTFLGRNQDIEPLVLTIQQFSQGTGKITEQKIWEVSYWMRYVALSFNPDPQYLSLKSGCQSLYDTLEGRMKNKDPESVLLNTAVTSIKRRDGNVHLTINSEKKTKKHNHGKSRYICNDAIIAFRPDDLRESTLKDITSDEKDFFSNLGYKGYVPSVFKMDLGDNLKEVGANQSTSLLFNPSFEVNVGIVTVQKERPEPDYPWKVFYQLDSPADTPESLELTKQNIISELKMMGFVNIKCLFIINHKYQVIPNSDERVKNWKPFFEKLNNDTDGLYWTGSVPAGENSDVVWEYSKRLLDNKFPDKA